METFKVEGEWWLLDDPDKRVAGTLSFDPDSGAELRLLGSLRGLRDLAQRQAAKGEGAVVTAGDLDASGDYGRVHGQVGGSAYTLEDCFRTRHNVGYGGGLETETVHANQVLKGVFFEQDEPAEATAASFRLRHLVYWILPNGLAERFAMTEGDSQLDDAPRFNVAAYDVPDQQVSLADGVAVTISQALGLSGDRIAKRSITQDCVARIDSPHPQPLSDLLRRASYVQSLVSMAVDRTACFEGMSFYHPDLVDRLPDGSSFPIPIEYFVRWRDRDGRSKDAVVHQHEMLFTYADLGLVEGVQRWLDVADTHQTALGRVMASRYQPSMYVSDRLLSRAAALESFDRVRTKKRNSDFKTRIRRCADMAGDVFTELVGNSDRWVDLLRDERDAVAHDLSGALVEGTDQFYVAESAYWLFVLCMLRASEAPDGAFTRIQSHGGFRWLAPRVKELVSPAHA